MHLPRAIAIAVLVLTASSQAGAQAQGAADPASSPILRVSAWGGASVPYEVSEVFGTGVSYGFRVAMPISEGASYLSVGYSRIGFDLSGAFYAPPRFEPPPSTVSIPIVHANLLFGFTSAKAQTRLYSNIGVGIDVEKGRHLFVMLGAGADLRVSHSVSVFAEVLPVFTTDPFETGWATFKLGAHYSFY